jgi:hypothetical protein
MEMPREPEPWVPEIEWQFDMKDLDAAESWIQWRTATGDARVTGESVHRIRDAYYDTSDLKRPITDSAGAFSCESPWLPAEGADPNAASRPVNRLDAHCTPRSL